MLYFGCFWAHLHWASVSMESLVHRYWSYWKQWTLSRMGCNPFLKQLHCFQWGPISLVWSQIWLINYVHAWRKRAHTFQNRWGAQKMLHITQLQTKGQITKYAGKMLVFIIAIHSYTSIISSATTQYCRRSRCHGNRKTMELRQQWNIQVIFSSCFELLLSFRS